MIFNKAGKTDIGVLEFGSLHSLCSTLMRFQEYYESPEFHGKVFTREEFEEWYAYKFGKFSYYEDWSGFNIPRRSFEEVLIHFPDLTSNERFVLSLVLPSDCKYIVGCVEGDMDTLIHEVAHGMYHIYNGYREDMMNLLTKIPKPIVKKIYKKFEEMGYRQPVWEDELHAYMVDGINTTYEFEFTDTQQKKVNSMIPQFNDVFDTWALMKEIPMKG